MTVGMVSYYNSTNMYRHQQAVTTPANASMHSWYTAGYHQTGQMAPEQQMWEQQIWHHHPHVSSHSVFANNEYPEFVHSGMVHNDGGHGQLMPSPTITVSGSDMSSPGAGSGNISPQNQSQVARPPPARSPYEWIKKTSYQSQPNPGEPTLLTLKLHLYLFTDKKFLLSRSTLLFPFGVSSFISHNNL